MTVDVRERRRLEDMEGWIFRLIISCGEFQRKYKSNSDSNGCRVTSKGFQLFLIYCKWSSWALAILLRLMNLKIKVVQWIHSILHLKYMRPKLYWPRQKWTMNGSLIFFKIVPIPLNLLPASFPLVEVLLTHYILYGALTYFFKNKKRNDSLAVSSPKDPHIY